MSNGAKASHNTYVIYVHPRDYDKFTKLVKTCIPRKQYLIELSKEVMKNYLDDDDVNGDWWTACLRMQKGIGKRMRKSRRKG